MTLTDQYMKTPTIIPSQIVECLTSVLTDSRLLPTCNLPLLTLGNGLYETFLNISSHCHYQFNLMITTIKVKIEDIKALFQSHFFTQLTTIDHQPTNTKEWMILLQPEGDMHHDIFDNEKYYSMHLLLIHGSCFKQNANGVMSQISQYEMFLKAFQEMLSRSILHWRKISQKEAQSAPIVQSATKSPDASPTTDLHSHKGD